MHVQCLVLAACSSTALATVEISFLFVNNCSINDTIWPALTGNVTQSPAPLPSNLALGSGAQYRSSPIAAPWSGRAWPRQGCNNGTCQVGDCGGWNCWGSSAGDTTLFEITIDYAGNIFYDISLGMFKP